MSDKARIGRVLADLRKAICTGFDAEALEMVLGDNDLDRSKIATGPSFVAHVSSLIDVARQEGWLIRLCDVLAAARASNKEVHSAIMSARQQLSDKHRPPTKIDVRHTPAEHPIVRFTSNLSIDEATLDFAIEDGGTNWAAAKIQWPDSSDNLLNLIQNATKTFDDGSISLEGSQRFISNAPAAISSCIRNRHRFQNNLPNLIHRMRGFKNDEKSRAIVGYLLLSNYVSHRQLAIVSAWQGLGQLGFQVPAAWVPFQRMTIKEAVLKLLGRGDNQLDWYAVDRIGEFQFPSKTMAIYVPPRFLPFNNTLEPTAPTISSWMIPSVETRYEQLTLPETYSGKWHFSPGPLE